MAIRKTHWYDGWIFDRWVAPHQDQLFVRVKELLPAGSSVLDVGCGTGRLALALSDRCRRVMGIDLSGRNIAVAQRHLARIPLPGISFSHASTVELLRNDERFDVAILTYVLHEVPEEGRASLIRDALRLAARVMIADFLVPLPDGVRSLMNRLIERAAGSDHYKGFKSFVANGGVRGLVVPAEHTVVYEDLHGPHNSHLVVLQRRNG